MWQDYIPCLEQLPKTDAKISGPGDCDFRIEDPVKSTVILGKCAIIKNISIFFFIDINAW